MPCEIVGYIGDLLRGYAHSVRNHFRSEFRKRFGVSASERLCGSGVSKAFSHDDLSDAQRQKPLASRLDRYPPVRVGGCHRKT